MVLRLQRQALVNAVLSAGVLVVAGLALLVAGVIQHAAVPIGLGAVTSVFFALLLLRRLLTKLELRDGVLRSSTLFENHQVRVADITKIEPATVSWRNPLTGADVPSRVLRVCDRAGETNVWLNPVAYGSDPTRELLRAIGRDPAEYGL